MAQHVCPVWIGYLLLSPLRKLFHDPNEILNPYVKPGMKVLDVGSAMGYFSLPMARIVRSHGKVICVDVQEKMLAKLSRRADNAGLSINIQPHLCNEKSLMLGEYREEIDFALAFAVIHETPDPDNLFREVFDSLKSGGGLLVAEPKGHVSEEQFTKTISLAEKNHFIFISRPRIGKSFSAYFTKM